MSQNSFQKNPFINSSSEPTIRNSKFSNYDKLGRKTVEEVKQDMVDVKYNHFQEKIDRRTEVVPAKQPNNVPDFKSRVDTLRKINRG